MWSDSIQEYTECGVILLYVPDLISKCGLIIIIFFDCSSFQRYLQALATKTNPFDLEAFTDRSSVQGICYKKQIGHMIIT